MRLPTAFLIRTSAKGQSTNLRDWSSKLLSCALLRAARRHLLVRGGGKVICMRSALGLNMARNARRHGFHTRERAWSVIRPQRLGDGCRSCSISRRTTEAHYTMASE